jgi:hypothetical protein
MRLQSPPRWQCDEQSQINLEFYRLNYQFTKFTNETNVSSLTSAPEGEGRTARELYLREIPVRGLISLRANCWDGIVFRLICDNAGAGAPKQFVRVSNALKEADDSWPAAWLYPLGPHTEPLARGLRNRDF